VLSDHGQSQGATFLDRYGETLEMLVRREVDAGTVGVGGASSEALGYLGASLTEAAAGSAAPARALGRVTKSRTEDGELHLGEPRRPPAGERHADGVAAPAEEPPEVVVMASGCLGLVSFAREPGRVSLERIEALYPRLIPALREHPGIGFLLVRSERRGAVVLGRAGEHRLDDDTVEGEDPLAPFGEHAARHVRRTDGFPHCPDIVLNSTYWEQSDEVAAFEELVGSHGGMGGGQSFPFLLHPTELALPRERLIGAEEVHRALRRWLVQLGHAEYGRQQAPAGDDDGRGAPEAMPS
jgi:hypothetical protein